MKQITTLLKKKITSSISSVTLLCYLRNTRFFWSSVTLDHYFYKLDTKLRKSLKGILNFFKLQLYLRARTIYQTLFVVKTVFPKNLHLVFVFKFQCELCNASYYGPCWRHLNEGIEEHIRVSALTKTKVKLKDSAISDRLLLCNHLHLLKVLVY